MNLFLSKQLFQRGRRGQREDFAVEHVGSGTLLLWCRTIATRVCGEPYTDIQGPETHVLSKVMSNVACCNGSIVSFTTADFCLCTNSGRQLCSRHHRQAVEGAAVATMPQP